MILGDFMDIMDKIQESLQNNKHINKEVSDGIFELVIIFHNNFPNVNLENLNKRLKTLKIEKHNKKIPIYVLIIFISLLIGVSIYFYDGILSLLPLLINIILFISTYFKNPKYIRYTMLLCGLLWGIYNIYVGAYIICIGNFLEILSATISIIRYKKK